jgi:hypothetical protein
MGFFLVMLITRNLAWLLPRLMVVGSVPVRCLQ